MGSTVSLLVAGCLSWILRSGERAGGALRCARLRYLDLLQTSVGAAPKNSAARSATLVSVIFLRAPVAGQDLPFPRSKSIFS